MEQLIKRLFRFFGLEIMKFSTSSLNRRLKLISNYQIDHILDVGANKGQYALNLFASNFIGKISSFEPLSSAYSILYQKASSNPMWKTYRYALGEKNMQSEINVSENSVSSSLLEMLPQHIKSEPESQYVAKEMIDVKTLDNIWSEIIVASDRVFLKIDTQGFEKFVLKGAEQNLDKIILVQMELSIIPLYKGEGMFYEMVQFMKDKNFTLVSLEDGFTDQQTGHLLQIDGIFLNNNFVKE